VCAGKDDDCGFGGVISGCYAIQLDEIAVNKLIVVCKSMI